MNTERFWILLAKHKSGEATTEELAELRTLYPDEWQDAENKILDTIWQAPLVPVANLQVGDDLWQRIEKGAQQPLIKPLFQRTYTRWIAAAVLLAAVVTAGIILYPRGGKNISYTHTQYVSTQASSKRHMVLPDGTQVWLNSNSSLSYDDKAFGEKYREVTLVGEAFFDVTKDADHLFVIHASTINITVKGTAFNVKAIPGQKNVETSLIRGLVEITTQADTDRKILLRPNEKITVSVGTSPAKPTKNVTEAPLFVISKLHVDEQRVLPETAWMNTSLSFDNESMEQLAPKLESWFSVSIHVDNALKNTHFSGTITTESLQQTLDALKISSPFVYEIKGGEVWLHK